MNHQDESDEIRRALAIKKRLQVTWPAFFSRFGRLLPVQIEVIPKLLENKNLVICSPTASGKTEAVIAPIAEMLIENSQQIKGLKVVYVTPTRPLANDLFERIREPLEELGLTVSIKTGDRPNFNPLNPENFVITTPESLDSLMCRNPAVFEGLKYLILDELHLIDGSYRGDQIRLLIRRIDLRGIHPVYIILSATLTDPNDVATRYISSFEVVKVNNPREIEYELVDFSNRLEGINDLIQKFRRRKVLKVLFFCNSRKGTEELAKELREVLPSDKIEVHHGSVSKGKRREIEMTMRREREFYCVATTTLEVGIDIGDIDATVMVHPPLSVSSLVQRIGRGNRRKGITLAFGLFRGEDEKKLFEVMFEMARFGQLEQIDYEPSLSVSVQQIFSILYEKRFHGPSEEDLFNALIVLGITRQDLKEILITLKDKGFVEQWQDAFYPSQKLMDLAERGLIHSNIPDEREFRVIDTETHKEIGSISTDPVISSLIVLNGKIWEIVWIEKYKIYVKRARGESSATAAFGRRSSVGEFHWLLPERLRRVGPIP